MWGCSSVHGANVLDDNFFQKISKQLSGIRDCSCVPRTSVSALQSLCGASDFFFFTASSSLSHLFNNKLQAHSKDDILSHGNQTLTLININAWLKRTAVASISIASTLTS